MLLAQQPGHPAARISQPASCSASQPASQRRRQLAEWRCQRLSGRTDRASGRLQAIRSRGHGLPRPQRTHAHAMALGQAPCAPRCLDDRSQRMQCQGQGQGRNLELVEASRHQWTQARLDFNRHQGAHSSPVASSTARQPSRCLIKPGATARRRLHSRLRHWLFATFTTNCEAFLVHKRRKRAEILTTVNAYLANCKHY